MAGTILQSRQGELPVHQLVIAAHSHKAIAADHAGLQDVLCDFGAAVILGRPPGHGDGIFGDSSDDEILWTLWDGWERDRSTVRASECNSLSSWMKVNHKRTKEEIK